MPERCAQVAVSPKYRSGTLTPGQVVVEKPPDHVLVEMMGIQQALAHPARKVGNATEIGINGVGCVAPLGKVMRERINVRPQLAVEKPLCRSAGESYSRVYFGLLKWGDSTSEHRKNYVDFTIDLPPLSQATTLHAAEKYL
jgi:hypothetical protein